MNVRFEGNNGHDADVAAAMGQAKVEEAGAVIVCCGDPNAPLGQNLDEVLTEAAKHGISEEQNRKVKESISSVFGKPAGNAMGINL